VLKKEGSLFYYVKSEFMNRTLFMLIRLLENHDKVISNFRTAQAKEYSLDKEQTSYDDLLDALRLSLKGYQIK
jgi:arsenate reductase-like glutaredoxin family protein